MPDQLQFQEPEYSRPFPPAAKRSWLTSLVIKTGLATHEAGAQTVLLVILVATVLGIIWFAWPSGSSSPNVPLGPPPSLR